MTDAPEHDAPQLDSLQKLYDRYGAPQRGGPPHTHPLGFPRCR